MVPCLLELSRSNAQRNLATVVPCTVPRVECAEYNITRFVHMQRPGGAGRRRRGVQWRVVSHKLIVPACHAQWVPIAMRPRNLTQVYATGSFTYALAEVDFVRFLSEALS